MNKSSKNAQQRQITSLDEKHQEMLDRFHEYETYKIPTLKKEIKKWKKKKDNCKPERVDKILDMEDKIKELKREIKTLEHEKKEYLLNNSKYIFDYFESKKQISSGVQMQNVKVLNSFFKIKSTNENDDLSSDKYSQSKKMYQEYWRNVNKEFTNPQDYILSCDKCSLCEIGEMVPQDEEGIMICNNSQCGQFITYIVDNSKPNNKDPPNEVSYTAYIRLNHFKEILSQFQAKEYFEHIQYINSIFGVKPPIMNQELHETLCVLFIEIQKPWAVHCPPNRTNFFNYTYTLYQLCTLLDQTQYLPYIPMMKDREKQLEQDMIWKKVCGDLDWEFFPTV